MKPGDLAKTVAWHVDEHGRRQQHISYLWDLPGDGSDRGTCLAYFTDDKLALVLATDPGPLFGNEQVLVLVGGTYGWMWKGELEVVE